MLTSLLKVLRAIRVIKVKTGVIVEYDISDAEVAECLTTTNSEYLYAMTDREGKILCTVDDEGNFEIQLETGALCHPDAFPCLVYLNSEFYGIFAWQ